MRILILRSGEQIGGAEIYNLNLIRGFKKYHPEIELFFITSLLEFSQRIKKIGGRGVFLPVFNEEIGTKRGLVRLFFGLPKYLFYYSKTILKLRFIKNYKIVFIHSLTEKIFLTPLFKLFNFRIIWLEQGPVFAFKTTKIVLLLYRLISRLADKIITVSEDAKEDLLNGGIDKEKVRCIHTGVDTDYFRPVAKKQNHDPTVGYVGAICQEKGIEDFIKTSRLIVKKLKGVKFVLVGKGLVAEKNKNFIFPGFQEDIRPFLKDFDLFFFPTRHFEGCSLAMTEAMAVGIPVVARDIGGNRELVLQNRTGILFKNESYEELANIIIGLLADKEITAKMGQAARKLMVEEFNQKIWIEKIYHLFQ